MFARFNAVGGVIFNKHEGRGQGAIIISSAGVQGEAQGNRGFARDIGFRSRLKRKVKTRSVNEKSIANQFDYGQGFVVLIRVTEIVN